MKFSVLIPVYNTEKYVSDCIQSVLSQSYQDFEIILVDDGSTDKSSLICVDYERKNPEKIKVFHQNNSGQLISRVNGIRAAKGDYCVFLDADDLLVSSALEVISYKLNDYDLPDMLIYPFFYDREGMMEKSRVISEEDKVYHGKEILKLRSLFFSDILLNSIWTKAVKRDVLLSSINDIEKYSGLRCAEDRLHTMWILDTIKTAAFINRPLYRYRLFPDSTTRSYRVKNINRYNISVLYAEEKKYLLKWGFNTQNWIDRLNAEFMAHMIYVFDLFFMNTCKAERNAVIIFPWKSFLPEEIDLSCALSNPFLSNIQKELFQWILNRNEQKLNIYYIKKRCYQSLRRIKRKVFKQRENR